MLNSQSVSTITASDSTDINITTPVINVVYPYEDKRYENLTNTFIFGYVKPASSTLTINGVEVKPYKNGAFIAYLPVSDGDFYFNITARNGIYVSTFTRHVYIEPASEIEFSEENPFVLVNPSSYVYITKGNLIEFYVKGVPSSTVYYKIDDICSGYFLEIPENSGNYYTDCYISRDVLPDSYDLILKYKKGKLKGVKRKYADYINVRKYNYVIQTTTDNVVLKNDSGGYTLFMPEGSKLVADMKIGSVYRVNFNNLNLWVSDSNVKYLYDEAKKFYGRTYNLIFEKQDRNKVQAKLYVYDKVPYAAWEDNKKFYLELFYTDIRTNWIVYDSSDTFIDSVYYRQPFTHRGKFVFNFKKDLWGYDISYSTEGYMNIIFKFKPELKDSNNTKPLDGLRILIDPGHSPKQTPPYDGAVGTIGDFEYEINLAIALKLKDKLEAKGATVYMTRYTNDMEEQVPLTERPRIAKRLDADLYISIHNNAIADSSDPFEKERGFQIYYYHLHSKKFAESVHRSFVKNINLPDEGVRFGDYHVLRLTSMPSILVENAYMILPEQDYLLNDENFQQKLAETITEGVLDFIKNN